MELQQAMEDRRSIRKFQNTDIDDKVIYELLDVARIAPSAKNIQPWRFYIARGDLKNQIAGLMKAYHQSNPINTAGMLSTANAIEQSPALILVFRQGDGHSLERNDILSIGASIEHILLKATEKGLGSLWICAMYKVREEIARLVNVDMELYSAIAIGYADETPSPRPRLSLEDIIINNQ